LFSEWNDRGGRYLLAMDVTKFMMEGMAISQMTSGRSKQRVRRMIDYLADRLEEIFEDRGDSAIARHTQP
jgi:ribosomal protein S7